MSFGSSLPALPRRRLLKAALPALAVALLPRTAWSSPAVLRAARPLMGTRVDLVAQGDGAAAAAEAAFEEMARLEQMMSRYRRANPLDALQRAAGRDAVALPAELLSVLGMAQRLSQRSRGAFDITVGAYEGWSFDPARPCVPADADLKAARRLVNYRDLLLDPATGLARLRRPGMRLDLGGIAKLPILEAGLAVLRAHGIENAMLNGGGDVRSSGRLLGRPWRVGLRDPGAPQRLLGRLEIEGDAWVAASGDYERGFWRAGRHYHHILDPRSGRPSSGLHGLVLVARELEAVNGLGTALMVLGRERGQALLAPQLDALLVATDGSPPWMTPGMARRLLT
ncbi:FAD:protein FMN transferase [Roseateles sp. DAIF2]|uniref:FAD:protein FMN transferase n=1 Tax=Roseateles sp. DAIF2 TaxID=2714952 RepID=UPI0018A32EC7|nr:FAD:protein FMN transferase [Roseateles sp. DAIF2]QPF74001.1 FAD:protein FMN transferase [Roseateles sp. DAIF2]